MEGRTAPNRGDRIVKRGFVEVRGYPGRAVREKIREPRRLRDRSGVELTKPLKHDMRVLQLALFHESGRA